LAWQLLQSIFSTFVNWSNKMQNVFRKTLLACASTAVLGFASSSAMAQSFPDFTVNESAIAGTVPNTFGADKVTGNYVEVISFNGAATGGTFDVALKWNAGQFVANDGSAPVNSQLGGISANEYGLYALYRGQGSFSTTAAGTTFSFTPGGTLSLFADPNSNTTFNQPATGNAPFTTGNSSDDILIANGMPTSGQGTLDPSLSTCSSGPAMSGINCGSFGASSTFALTTAGTGYFTSPSPFYSVSFQSGQLNNFSATGTQVINGSLDVIFNGNAIPEPGVVALFGLGLLGLAASRRKSGKSRKA
jgi:hypothetical protein